MCSHVLRELHFARISYARALRLSLPLFLHLFRPPFLPPFLAWSLALQEAAYVLMYQKVSTSAATLSTQDYVSFCPTLDRALVEAIASTHQAPGDIIKKLDETQAEGESQQQDAEEAAASLVGLEHKPKAPTCAAKVEKVVCPLI
jgi:hypothetical protein